MVGVHAVLTLGCWAVGRLGPAAQPVAANKLAANPAAAPAGGQQAQAALPAPSFGWSGYQVLFSPVARAGAGAPGREGFCTGTGSRVCAWAWACVARKATIMITSSAENSSFLFLLALSLTPAQFLTSSLSCSLARARASSSDSTPGVEAGRGRVGRPRDGQQTQTLTLLRQILLRTLKPHKLTASGSAPCLSLKWQDGEAEWRAG